MDMMILITKIMAGLVIMPSTRLDHAGRRQQAEHQESQFQPVMPTTIEMLISVTINVMTVLSDMDQSAGRLALIILKVTEHTATSHMLMEEVPERSTSAMDVRNGELFGTLLVRRIITM